MHEDEHLFHCSQAVLARCVWLPIYNIQLQQVANDYDLVMK